MIVQLVWSLKTARCMIWCCKCHVANTGWSDPVLPFCCIAIWLAWHEHEHVDLPSQFPKALSCLLTSILLRLQTNSPQHQKVHFFKSAYFTEFVGHFAYLSCLHYYLFLCSHSKGSWNEDLRIGWLRLLLEFGVKSETELTASILKKEPKHTRD